MNSSVPCKHLLLVLFLAFAATVLVFVPKNAVALLPFESTGNLYVSMWSADEVAVFSPDGTPLERFTVDGLDGPRGIAFNPANGEIWVAGEFSDAIFVFDHEHELQRMIDHEDFDEPVGVTFQQLPGVNPEDQLVYISNSNGNEIMVFDQAGNLVRRFTGDSLEDPNCAAFMPDGSLFVSNRLGGTSASSGAVSRFDSSDNYQFDFEATGMASVMAVARDPNTLAEDVDDTLWVTSGAGNNGIFEFDPSGNLITTLLSGDIDDGRSIVPQGIAFDSEGNFFVVSFLNEVIKFDPDGNFLMRFPTGEGTSRSTAFQGCQADQSATGECVPLGVDAALVSTDGTNNGNDEGTTDQATNETTGDNSADSTAEGSGSGGGTLFLSIFPLFLLWQARRLIGGVHARGVVRDCAG